MSKKKVIKTVHKKKVAAKVTPTVARTKTAANTPMEGGTTVMTFQRQNYIYLVIGAAMIIIGMLLMIGGGMDDPNTWDPDIIYNKRITVLGPVIIVAGLILEIVGIFKRT